MKRRSGIKIMLLVLGLSAGLTGLLLSAGGSAQPVTGRPTAIPTPSPVRPPLLAAALGTDAPVPTAAGLAAALGARLQDGRLGEGPAFAVVDVLTGQVLLSNRPGAPVVPASTAKIATAVGVLLATDPGQRLRTRVLAGPLPGDVVLVGGGDPTLAGPAAGPSPFGAAQLVDLAAQTRTALGSGQVRRVLVDDRLFTGPSTGADWKPGYVSSGNVAPVMALSLDGGRIRPDQPAREADPALAAGRALARLLVSAGPSAGPASEPISVERGAGVPGAAVLGAVLSPPVPVLVGQMLERSDNDLAEALTRQVALARGLPASFVGGAQAVAAVLTSFAGADTAAGIVLQDGSGLSRSNQVQPVALAALLGRAARDPRLRPLLTGLPVAGFDGTLTLRFLGPGAAPAAGEVRAKTGTLEGVSALAGLVRTASGRLLAFDLTAEGTLRAGTPGAEAALDDLAAVLASCGCR